VRYPRERAQRLGDRVVVHAGGAGRGRGGGGVLAVVRAGDERLRRQRVAGGELDSLEAEAARHDLRPGPLEDAQFRVAVGLEGAVPVEMVGLEVEQHGDTQAQALDVLELETGELADDPTVGVELTVEVADRPADIAGHLHLATGRAEDRAQKLGRRRLAVSAGDADQGVGKEA